MTPLDEVVTVVAVGLVLIGCIVFLAYCAALLVSGLIKRGN